MRSMVFSREREMGIEEPQRSKPLHNFNLPCLKWGNRRYLRCMKLDDASSSGTGSSAAADQNQHCRRRLLQRRRSPPAKPDTLMVGGMRRRESESSSSPSSNKNTVYVREQPRLRISSKGEAAVGIEAVKEEIMMDLKTAADEIKGAIFRDEVSDEDDDDEDEFEEPKNKQRVNEKEKEKEREEPVAAAVEVVEARPWNLRTRRAACKAPINEEVNNNNYSSPTKNEVIQSARVRDRGPSVASPAASEKKRPLTEVTVPLSKKEIEDDIMAMVGRRPLRRPKKRARNVQKQLEYSYPGSWLTDVTVDSYKVPELAEEVVRGVSTCNKFSRK